MPTEYTIIDVRTLPTADPLRAGKLDAIVVYQTDPMHTYTVTVPKEDATPERLKPILMHENEDRLKLIGQKIVV